MPLGIDGEGGVGGGVLDAPHYTTQTCIGAFLPLPAGEVAARSADGEGKTRDVQRPSPTCVLLGVSLRVSPPPSARRIRTKGPYVSCMRHFFHFFTCEKDDSRAKYVQIEKFFMERAFYDCIFVLSCCILVLIKNDCLPALQYDSFFSSRMAYCRAGNDKINSKEQRTCLLK